MQIRTSEDTGGSQGTPETLLQGSCLIPPRSPYSLIQEDLWPDEFKILVSCMLLNCTTRKAVEKVLPRLFRKYPDATAMSQANPDDLSQIIACLGFKNRRTNNIIEMSKHFLSPTWKHANELPGIGVYASAAWEIFVLRRVPDTCPKDHALTLWWNWYQRHYATS